MTTESGISKAKRILHNRSPIVILHFLSIQARLLHFHYVGDHAACQHTKSPPSCWQGTWRVSLRARELFLHRIQKCLLLRESKSLCQKTSLTWIEEETKQMLMNFVILNIHCDNHAAMQ